jgi:MFS family permease
MTNDQDTQRRSLSFYLVLSFIEGGAAMAAELLGARMIAPFYGTTLFVWSSVIGVTLAALALGYFLGGYLADRYTRNMLLFSVLAVGSVLLALMPNLAKFSLEATSGMGIRTGSLVSALVFLLPPLVCLGMSSPVIIRLAKVFFHLSMLPLPPSAESRA